MSAHPPHISEEMLGELPETISRFMQRMLLVIGLATTLISVAGEWSHGQHVLREWLVDNASSLAVFLNLLLISLALFPGRTKRHQEEFQDETVSRIAICLNTFALRALNGFWWSLGFLYSAQLFKSLALDRHDAAINLACTTAARDPQGFAIEIFSVCSTFFLFLTYASLTPGFLCSQVAVASPRRASWLETDVFWQCLAPCLLIAGLLALVMLVPFSSQQLTGSYDIAIKINGLVSAIALAMVVGRIDTRFALNWQWSIPLMFAYAGVQVFSIALHSPNPALSALYAYTTFTLKCVLLITFNGLFEQRRILFYAVNMVELSRRDV